jgi:hypothetical protein
MPQKKDATEKRCHRKKMPQKKDATEKRCHRKKMPQKKDARHLIVTTAAFLTTFCRHESCPIH